MKVKIADIVNNLNNRESQELTPVLCLLFQEVGRRLFDIERSRQITKLASVE